tara:strand:- start:96 stop:677 length:582 start_codon:yes stop_codon:yes gene_type:complete
MKTFDTLEFFPTLFYEFTWTEDEIRPLLEEIKEKKVEIKIQSNSDSRTDDYWTDYTLPVKLLEYEKLIEKVSTAFFPKLQCSHIVHWTAIYGEKGYHATHNHKAGLFELIDPNMSTILYLSDIGGTQFRNPYQSDQIHSVLYMPSKVGKMIMFPSHILHSAPPHGKKNEERVIISSNWRVQEIFPGSFHENNK